MNVMIYMVCCKIRTKKVSQGFFLENKSIPYRHKYSGKDEHDDRPPKFEFYVINHPGL